MKVSSALEKQLIELQEEEKPKVGMQNQARSVLNVNSILAYGKPNNFQFIVCALIPFCQRSKQNRENATE